MPQVPPDRQNRAQITDYGSGDTLAAGDTATRSPKVPPDENPENRAQNSGSGDTGDTGDTLHTSHGHGDQDQKIPNKDLPSHASHASHRPKVVNVRTTKEPCEYIGRSEEFGGPTKWGNPYIIGTDGTREEVVAKHEEWFLSDKEIKHEGFPFSNKELRSQLQELRGKNLGCHCAPRPCHGDLYLSLANTNNFFCKNCNFVVDRTDYDHHTVTKHPNKAGYPDKNGRTP